MSFLIPSSSDTTSSTWPNVSSLIFFEVMMMGMGQKYPNVSSFTSACMMPSLLVGQFRGSRPHPPPLRNRSAETNVSQVGGGATFCLDVQSREELFDSRVFI